MSVEHELLRRLAWGLFFAVGLIALAWLFGAWGALPLVALIVLWFTMTKKA